MKIKVRLRDLGAQLPYRTMRVLDVLCMSSPELKDNDFNAIDPETRAQLKALGSIY